MRFQRMNNKLNEKESYGSSEAYENEEQNLNNQNVQDCSDMLTLEGLRRTYNSCSNCGVSWYDDHISLDCSECGGYAMHRPCPTCNGQCGSMWRRDVKASHVSKRAQWHGNCSMNCQSQNLLTTMSEDKNANFQDSYHCLSQSLMCKAQIM
ncbi:protein pinocchio [Caerostris darwini]|uniref:Protein pinocchio n=1 Tax=Caerostris darwini TaxID=1538125 RepID=A0AAV4SWD7_9ARAC|nr:protein pinocchio [Caerostris darwini]